MSDVLRRNVQVLERLSPDAAAAVTAAGADGRYSVTWAASGRPVIECAGRALDSRRDPVAAGEREAASAFVAPGVLFGFGTGYLAEALIARGAVPGAIVVQDAAALRAALEARPLAHVCGTVPVFLLEQLTDRVTLARVRAFGERAVVHAASALQEPALAAMADRWPRIRPARRPRVLVVGPIYGGSLGVARLLARAVEQSGCETAFFDAADFAPGHRALAGLPTHPRTHEYLRGKLVLLLGEAVVEVARAFGPDLVIALAQAPLSGPSLGTLRDAGIRTAFWFVENWRVLSYWREIAPHYDAFYAIQRDGFLEQLRDAGAPWQGYLPMACDPQRHVPVSLTGAERERFGADVSFAGAPYLNRRHIFAALTDFNLRLWGDGWDGTPLATRADGSRFGHDEMLRIFAATAVNLNLHSADHTAGLDPTPDYVNPRTFELASCGAFQLVDARGPLPQLFGEDEMVTFRSVQELRSLVAHYLARPGERQQIAERARSRVHREHTYAQRVETVLRDQLAPELVAGARWDPGPSTLEQALAAHASGPLSLDEALLRMVADVRDTVRAL